mgnify:CR=1 FL=1
MPKGSNQHLKLYYLAKIMLEETDNEHGITLDEIISALEDYDITAERKQLYKNLDELQDLGIEVDKVRNGNSWYYHVVERPLDITELKLMVDSIQASRFISEKRSARLIKKLSDFASIYEARKLSRQVFVKDRPKTTNDKSYYNVDMIHDAIADNRKIRFRYFNWTTRKTKQYHHGEDYYYLVSPWALAWQEENYYLIANDSADDTIRHFRVDKMEDVSVTEDKRDGAEQYNQFNLPVYLRQTFGMYGGRSEDVKIRVKNDAAGIFIDRFGADISFKPDGEEYSTLYVPVMVSDKFYAWIFALGDKAQIIGPEWVVDGAKDFLIRLNNLYISEKEHKSGEIYEN